MSDNDDDFEDFDEIKERGKSGVKPVPVPLLDPHQGDAHYYADLTRGPDAKRLFDSASSTGCVPRPPRRRTRALPGFAQPLPPARCPRPPPPLCSLGAPTPPIE